jgi:GR25 family glycosyltransferase involved in LPS biosynthesis
MENLYGNISRVEAYDGNKLNEYNDIILPKNHKHDKYEIGAAFSHIKAIIQAYKNNDTDALIMEDDVSNEYCNKWTKTIEEIILNAPKNCDCLSFFCSNMKIINKMKNINTDYYKSNNCCWGACCYYINRTGMKKIYDLFYKNGIIDLSIKLKDYRADIGILYGGILNTYNYTKPTFQIQLFNTTIHNDEKSKHDKFALNIHKYIKIYFTS